MNVPAIAWSLVCIPDEELTEPIHYSAGYGLFACGIEPVGVAVWDPERVTCPECRRTLGLPPR